MIARAFHQVLHETGIVIGDENAPMSDALIPYGTFKLIDNSILGASLCDQVAIQTKAFYTFIEFKRLQNNAPEKPIEPDKEAPEYWPSKYKQYAPELIQKYSTKNRDGLQFLRATERAVNVTNAQKDYEERLQSYQKLLLQSRTIRARYNFDERGYLAFVCDTLKETDPDFVEAFFFTPKTLWINEKAREKHTFIVAGTGAGKSESIKHIIRHYITKNTEPAIVVLDPHAKLAPEVAQMAAKINTDRLVYVHPRRFKGRHTSFNPFDTPPDEKGEDSINISQLQFLSAIGQLIGHELSEAQEALLTPCLGVILHKDGTTFRDLITFMNDETNSGLVEYGKQHLPNADDREFFKLEFYKKNFDLTKSALAYRFRQLVRDPAISSFLCKPSTFDLVDNVEAGKIMCFSFELGKQSRQSIKTIGKLITAFLVSHSMKRGEGNGRPIHLFADECQYFASPAIEEIMGETRKFGLYATLACQRVKQINKHAPGLLDALLGNVGCYIVGRSKGETSKKLSEELSINRKDILQLESLQFIQHEIDRAPLTTRIDYIGKKYGLKGKAWKAVLDQQKELYYVSGFAKPEYEEHVIKSAVTASNKKRTHQTNLKPQGKVFDVSTKTKHDKAKK